MTKLTEKDLPIGTPVKYYPIAGESKFIKTEITSVCWTLANGELGVHLKGIAGGIEVTNLKLLNNINPKENINHKEIKIPDSTQYAFNELWEMVEKDPELVPIGNTILLNKFRGLCEVGFKYGVFAAQELYWTEAMQEMVNQFNNLENAELKLGRSQHSHVIHDTKIKVLTQMEVALKKLLAEQIEQIKNGV